MKYKKNLGKINNIFLSLKEKIIYNLMIKEKYLLLFIICKIKI